MSAGDVAMQYFHIAPMNLPCSSAIMATYKGARDAQVQGTMHLRGGNAPNNECGAISAAKLVRPDLEDNLLNKFQEVAGSWKCADLRGDGKFGCANCLKLASQVLEDHGEVPIPAQNE
ncbi:hypothetical protein SS50377_25508 [Spironucleus salmonicida]|uniref:Uncharacterized protein n=1 Tax=Spironucleus salmonicida TaxID=348837 RepID=V6LKA1_9EUKA|nr:hypothetical protein SS50377_25508 [Spironucleus salmonicida]|eukprot:EST45055.1 hypothetical protein SS50377_15075 [Spironucleus salmonicida]